MKFISTSDVPAPGGHYSQAVESAGFIFLSGILPSKAEAACPAPFEDQVRSVLQHGKSILAAAACTLDDVVQCTAYIVGVQNWPVFNDIYGTCFGAHRPARTVVPVPELHHGFLVEIQLTAVRRTQ
jgi:reactive intermediate/imine deaminase